LILCRCHIFKVLWDDVVFAQVLVPNQYFFWESYWLLNCKRLAAFIRVQHTHISWCMSRYHAKNNSNWRRTQKSFESVSPDQTLTSRNGMPLRMPLTYQNKKTRTYLSPSIRHLTTSQYQTTQSCRDGSGDWAAGHNLLITNARRNGW
jgi:hypothetical protein